MKTRRNLVMLSVLAVWLAGCGESTAVPEVFPAEAQGKIVLVNYWAEWCKPCREEIPELNQFLADNRDTVVLYGVNFDGLTGDDLARVEAELGIAFPTLAADPGPALHWPTPAGLPHTVVTDSSGARRIDLSGVQTGESLAAAVAEFAKTVGESP